MAARVGLHQHGALAAADRLVVGRFKAVQAGIVGADVTEQVGSQLAVGIEPLALLHEADALHFEGGNALGLDRRRAALDVLKGGQRSIAPLAGQALDQLVAIFLVALIKGAAQPVGCLDGIVNVGRDGVNGVGIDAVGQQPAVSIDDLAALARRLLGFRLLAFGPQRQLIVLPYLQHD